MLKIEKIYLPEFDLDRAYLTECEYRQLSKLKAPKRRVEYQISRWLRRTALGHAFNISPDTLMFDKMESGKPICISHPHIYFNMSHSGDWIVMALSDQAVGIDIEMPNPKRKVLEIAEHYFAASEITVLNEAENPLDLFYQLWTLKESYVKATGQGIVSGLSECVFEFQDSKFVPSSALKGYQFQQECLGDGTYMAVCSRERKF